MSFLHELIEQLCDHDGEFKELLNNINIKYKENLQLRKEIEEQSKMLDRRQMECVDLKMVVDNLSKTANAVKASSQNVDVCYQLKRNIESIDFIKGFQYEVLQTREEYTKDWQQIQQAILQQLKWQEAMSQRHIVQKYNLKMNALHELQEEYKTVQATMAAEYKERSKQAADSIHKRNMLICDLVKESKELYKLKDSLQELRSVHAQHILLKQKKADLVKQLNNLHYDAANGDLLQKFKIEIPKFPSIDNILKNLSSTTEKSEQTASLETIAIDDNNSCITYVNSDKLEASTLSQQEKLTKHVQFKLPIEEIKILDEISNVTNSVSNDENLSDVINGNIIVPMESSEDIFRETEEENYATSVNNLEAEITNEMQFLPVLNKEMNSTKSNASGNTKTVPLIHIQECVVIQPAKLSADHTASRTSAKTVPSVVDVEELSKQVDVKIGHKPLHQLQNIEDDVMKLLSDSVPMKNFEDYLSKNASLIFSKPNEWNEEIVLSGNETIANDFKFDTAVNQEGENNSNPFIMDFSDDNADVTDNFL